MKKTILLTLSIFMSYFLSAQETTKQKELGLTFSSLNSFGLTYKTGTQKAMWRFNSLLASGSNSSISEDSLERKRSSNSFGLSAGREYRKNISDNLELRLGADLSFNYSKSMTYTDDKSNDNRDYYNLRTSYGPGIDLVFGFNYIIKDNLVLGAELLPGFNYSFGKSRTKQYSDDYSTMGDQSGFNYGLSNTSARLSISYRFKKTNS